MSTERLKETVANLDALAHTCNEWTPHPVREAILRALDGLDAQVEVQVQRAAAQRAWKVAATWDEDKENLQDAATHIGALAGEKPIPAAEIGGRK